MTNNSTSKFISLILRHKPEVIGITLDEHTNPSNNRIQNKDGR